MDVMMSTFAIFAGVVFIAAPTCIGLTMQPNHTPVQLSAEMQSIIQDEVTSAVKNIKEEDAQKVDTLMQELEAFKKKMANKVEEFTHQVDKMKLDRDQRMGELMGKAVDLLPLQTQGLQDEATSWLKRLLSKAEIQGKYIQAAAWAEKNGIVETDVRMGDAWKSLISELGLKKYEAQRLQRAAQEPVSVPTAAEVNPEDRQPDILARVHLENFKTEVEMGISQVQKQLQDVFAKDAHAPGVIADASEPDFVHEPTIGSAVGLLSPVR